MSNVHLQGKEGRLSMGFATEKLSVVQLNPERRQHGATQPPCASRLLASFSESVRNARRCLHTRKASFIARTERHGALKDMRIRGATISSTAPGP